MARSMPRWPGRAPSRPSKSLVTTRGCDGRTQRRHLNPSLRRSTVTLRTHTCHAIPVLPGAGRGASDYPCGAAAACACPRCYHARACAPDCAARARARCGYGYGYGCASGCGCGYGYGYDRMDRVDDRVSGSVGGGQPAATGRLRLRLLDRRSGSWKAVASARQTAARESTGIGGAHAPPRGARRRSAAPKRSTRPRAENPAPVLARRDPQPGSHFADLAYPPCQCPRGAAAAPRQPLPQRAGSY